MRLPRRPKNGESAIHVINRSLSWLKRTAPQREGGKGLAGDARDAGAVPLGGRSIEAGAHGTDPGASRPDLSWRTMIREAVFELDADGRILTHSAGRLALFDDIGDAHGLFLIDRLRASDRVVFLHAASQAQAGTTEVPCRVTFRLDEAGREWAELACRLRAHGSGMLVLIDDAPPDGIDAADAAQSGMAGMTPDLSPIGHETSERPTDDAVGMGDGEDENAVLAHELRTPLNAIMGYAQALEAGLFGPLNARQGDALRQISRASEHLIEVADNVLDEVRLRSDGAMLTPLSASPVEETERACSMVAGLATERGVTIANRVTRGCGVGRFDAPSLRQILVNLLANAVRASGSGAIVGVQAWRDEGSLVMAVHDQGCGMSAEEIDGAGNVLTLRPAKGHGSSAHDTPAHDTPARERRRDATTGGLGLRLVRSLVARHGGTLEIASAPGQGTRVLVRLPDADVQPVEGGARADKTATPLRGIEAPTDASDERATRLAASRPMPVAANSSEEGGVERRRSSL